MKTYLIALVLLAAAGLNSGVSAQPKKDEGVIPPPEQLVAPDEPPLGGFIILDDHWWSTVLADEANLKMEDAADHLKSHDWARAGKDIRKVAAHTRIAAARSPEAIRNALMGSVADLDALARSVEAGHAPGEQEVAVIFARDLQLLAQHHAHKSGEHWLAGKRIDAGYDLKAAALDLRQAARWGKSAAEMHIDEVVVRAENAADRLIEEEAVGEAEATGLIAEVQEQARALGSQLRKES